MQNRMNTILFFQIKLWSIFMGGNWNKFYFGSNIKPKKKVYWEHLFLNFQLQNHSLTSEASKTIKFYSFFILNPTIHSFYCWILWIAPLLILISTFIILNCFHPLAVCALVLKIFNKSWRLLSNLLDQRLTVADN